jgi:hypothetical protein
MSALDTEELKLYEHAKGVLPKAIFEGGDESDVEFLHAFVKIFQPVKDQMDEWFAKTYISAADGQWLDAHAKDRGTFRQDGELDADLRARIKTIEDTVTKPALLALVNEILAAAGVSGGAAMVELRRNRAWFRTDATTSRKDTYLSRGYRLTDSGAPSGIILILPYGTSAGTANAVYEAIRSYKAGGFKHYVERRVNP